MLSNRRKKVLRRLEKEKNLEIIKNEKGEKNDKNRKSLAIPREEGKFIYTLIHAMKANMIIEIGISFNYSTIWLAAAIKNNNVRVISFDIFP